jgi:superfamily I DNA/RNA helicase
MLRNHREEADWVATRAQELRKQGVRFKDMAVLYRRGIMVSA